MATPILPLLLEPEILTPLIFDPQLLIVDLSKPKTFAQYHIPQAIHLNYPEIVHIEKPIMGLLPDNDQLSSVLSAIGLTQDKHVIAYDDEGGGKAARLLWTLDVLGHTQFSLLNGGLHAWINEGHETQQNVRAAAASAYRASAGSNGITNMEYILNHLQDPSIRLLDARSAEEFNGSKKFAEKAGHIPGAVNMDWLQIMDTNKNLRFKTDEQLKTMLSSLGIFEDQEIIVYCQSHHRSALTYIMLKHLGYPNIKGYPGAWSEWGNASHTPVELG